LKTPTLAVDAVCEAVSNYKANGYTDTEGSAAARTAVAQVYSSPEFELSGKDVFMANGASGAIWLAIGAICPRGSNVLLPRPGFTYCVAADPMGVECRYYNCLVFPCFVIDG
jgi:aspartate/methionine/tyrosine aminotransferase